MPKPPSSADASSSGGGAAGASRARQVFPGRARRSSLPMQALAACGIRAVDGGAKMAGWPI